MSYYVLDNSWQKTRRRLELLEGALDRVTFRRLQALGVGAGWRCLEIGAGAGSVCAWLASEVGKSGRVTATDLDTSFIEPLAGPNLSVLRHNVVADELPETAFDLIHARWVLMHIAQRDKVLPRLVAALKPGGWLVLEDPDDYPTAATAPGPCARAWEATAQVFEELGAQVRWARGLPTYLQQQGLDEIGAETAVQLFAGASPLAEFWQLTWLQLQERMLAAKLREQELADAMAQLADPKQWFYGAATVTAWGRKPRSQPELGH
jgi:ubiquinone/menaquinone biosynthesis C-methylase UbiE